MTSLTPLHRHTLAVSQAARTLARTSTFDRNNALHSIANALRAHVPAILTANQSDLDRARSNHLDDAFIDRLRLSMDRIEAMARAVEDIAALPDPVGEIVDSWTRPNGLRIHKRRLPLGVVGIIYEARPNVTSDAASLCLKSGNGVILKGGSNAFRSNQAIVAALQEGLRNSSLPAEATKAIGFVNTTDRNAVQELLTLNDAIDVIIPRGGKGLIDFVDQHARMPVIKHDEGVCHIVVDGSADPEQVDAILLNAKTQRPGVCNAMESLLFLDNAVEPHLDRTLVSLHRAGVTLHLCPESLHRAETLGITNIHPADDDAYAREFLSLELSLRIVPTLDEAIAHIDRFGSHHTEALLTNDLALSQKFVDTIDASVVMINASTRFSDGGELGLGAEIGISTTRMHAYGPMGLRELTTTRFVVEGSGQIRL